MTSNSKLIKNEQLIRDKNKTATFSIKRYFGGTKDVLKAPIDFMCECSDLKCDEHVSMSIEEYEAIHKRKDRFVVAEDHATPLVENVVKRSDNYDTVEKPQLAS